MASVAERAIREPSVDSARQYGQRIRRLAWAYVGVFLGSCIGIGLIVWQAQFFVTLSQRSNVETLTLAFFLIFFGYLIFLTAGGVWGVAHILYFAILSVVRPDPVEVGRLKLQALGPPRGHEANVALNVALELDARPGQAFTIPVEDTAGSMGEIAVDGAQVRHSDVHPLAPVTPGSPYRVSVLIHNPDSGHGGVSVTALLRDKKTGVVYAQTQQVVVMLDPGQTRAVVLNVDAPRASYAVQVQLTYPLGAPGAPGPPTG